MTSKRRATRCSSCSESIDSAEGRLSGHRSGSCSSRRTCCQPRVVPPAVADPTVAVAAALSMTCRDTEISTCGPSAAGPTSRTAWRVASVRASNRRASTWSTSLSACCADLTCPATASAASSSSICRLLTGLVALRPDEGIVTWRQLSSKKGKAFSTTRSMPGAGRRKVCMPLLDAAALRTYSGSRSSHCNEFPTVRISNTLGALPDAGEARAVLATKFASFV